jgi:hypothetical protein
MIECPKCQHDNDLGRIFCAKCGEKLDISRVRAPSGIRRKKGRAVPFDKAISIAITKFIKIAFLAAFAALLTALWAPPKVQRSPLAYAHVETFQHKFEELTTMLDSQQEGSVIFTEGDINASMAQAVHKAVQKQKDASGAKLEGIYIQLRKGDALITVQNKWKWFKISVQIQAQPTKTKTGGYTFSTKRLWIGRMQIPNALNDQLQKGLISTLWSNFQNEKQILERLQGVDITPGKVTLISKSEA